MKRTETLSLLKSAVTLDIKVLTLLHLLTQSMIYIQIACSEISLSPFTIYIFVFIIDIAASIMIIIMHYELMPLFVQVLSNFDLKPLVRRIYFHKNVIKLPPLFDFCVGDIFILFYFLSYNIIA